MKLVNKLASHSPSASLPAIALALAVCCSSESMAQDAKPQEPPTINQTEQHNAVEIKAIRDPAIMPYQRAYQMMTRLQGLNFQDVRLSLRVLDGKTHKAVPDLEISLEGKETRQKLKISETGEVTIPIDAQAYADGAEFIANKKRNSLLVDIHLAPVLPEAGFPYAAISDSSESAMRTLREIIPWYYRLFTPNPKGVALCYEQPQHQIELRGQQLLRIPADQKLTDRDEKTVYCAKLAATTKADVNVVPEPGWRAQFY